MMVGLLLLLDLAALTAQLESEQPMERYEAARALGKLGDKAALPALAGALTDAEMWVRVEAARALVRVGITKAQIKPILRRLPRAQPEFGVLLAQALAGLGRPAVAPLLEAIEEDDGHAPLYALTALTLAGRAAAEAVPDLIDLLKHKRPDIRRAAGEALRQLGPWAAGEVPALLDKLKYGDAQTKWVVIGILGRIGPPAKAAIEPLRAFVKEDEGRLKEAAAQALKTIDVAPVAVKADPKLSRPALAKERAPDRFVVRLETTKGDVEVEIQREWAPHGADRVYNLVKIGYFTDLAFFRVVEGFVAQFGIHGDRAIARIWSEASIPDDPVRVSNRTGWLVFAAAGQNTRTTQLFFNLADNDQLDARGFAPVGRVTKGWNVVKSLYSGYREKPNQQNIFYEGNAYLKREFPKLDYIKRAKIVK